MVNVTETQARGVWLGPPSSQSPPLVPAEGRPKKLNPLGAEAPKQTFACQPQTLEGEEGEGEGEGGLQGEGGQGGVPLPLRFTAVIIHH